MSKENRIGALWTSQSTSERAPFAKGKIEMDGKSIDIVLWRNGWKAQDLASDDPEKRAKAHRQPDYYLERDAPRETGQGGAQTALGEDGPTESPARVAAPAPSTRQGTLSLGRRTETQAVASPSGDGFDDDIPF